MEIGARLEVRWERGWKCGRSEFGENGSDDLISKPVR